MSSEERILEQLKSRLSQLRVGVGPFSGTVYRSCTPRYANQSDLITGTGSFQYGGRWSPVGIAVVYSSLTPEVAMAETLANNRYYEIAIEDSMPRTFVAIMVSLRSIVDLRVGAVRQSIRVSLDRTMTVDWRREVREGRIPITQLIGRASFEIGFEGIIVPSVADPTGSNLLVYPEKLQLGSVLRVLNADRLTK